MIKRVRIQNYKALRDVTVELSPLTVLIGPNDSGKTSILEAIGALCRSVDMPLGQAFGGRWQNAQLVWRQDPSLTVCLAAQLSDDVDIGEYELQLQFPTLAERQAYVTTEVLRDNAGADVMLSAVRRTETTVWRVVRGKTDAADDGARSRNVHAALSGVQAYRWVTEQLALPVAPTAERQFSMEPTGFGLARCLDDILGADRQRFDGLVRRFRQIFPEFADIQLMPEMGYQSAGNGGDPLMFSKSPGKGIQFVAHGSRMAVPAAQVSDGVLLVLAYLAILHLPRPPRVILIEEPENGIHPRRLQDVLAILKELVQEQSHAQLILTTHSPYALDLFDPTQVLLCRKDAEGAVHTLSLSDSEIVREQRSVFTLGEIWTAEGDDGLAGIAATPTQQQ